MSVSPSPNPYNPPNANLMGDQAQLPYEDAGRGSRLLAAIIDAIIGIVCSLPLWLLVDDFKGIFSGIKPPMTTLMLGMVYVLVCFVVIHGYLLHNYGQTVGKRLMGIYIANHGSAQKTDFKDIFIKRLLPVTAATLVPVVGNFFSLIDALMIFRADKRCIHDHIAATHVLKVKKAQPVWR